MDNEAGLEHLSRCTTQDVDVLLIVSNGLPVSLQAAFRVHELTERLALRIGGQYLVLNDVDLTDEARIKAKAQRTGLELLGVVPSDSRLRQLSREGEPLSQLAADSAARKALREILEAALSPTAAALQSSEETAARTDYGR
jgi:CO dehydrogenase maturation factor